VSSTVIRGAETFPVTTTTARGSCSRASVAAPQAAGQSSTRRPSRRRAIDAEHNHRWRIFSQAGGVDRPGWQS
jgi:hypothetical protein